jgi:ATP phosphoribosyltransferase
MPIDLKDEPQDLKTFILAVPSKGRLEEKSAEIFSKAGLTLIRDGARGYQGEMAGIDSVRVEYVSAGDIAARLAEGSAHMGITGEDLLREEIADFNSAIHLVSPLGFGQADVVVAIPDGWVDVTTMNDLADVAAEFRARHGRRLRVATKYTHLTTDFFARHGADDCELVQSFGATEGAPGSGAAEAIVDITSTGATLAANNLRIPEDGVILKSEAQLAASLKADWSDKARAAAKFILTRLEAYQIAKKQIKVSLRSSPGMASPVIRQQDIEQLQINYGAKLVDMFTGSTDQGSSYTFVLPANQQAAFMDDMIGNRLFAIGEVSKPDFLYFQRCEMLERLLGRLV